MPLSDYAPGARQFIGLADFAVRNGVRSQQFLQTVSATAQEEGIKLTFADFQSLPSLYSNAASRYRGAIAFQAAVDEVNRTGIDQVITAEMLNPAPWSPSPADWNLNPRFSARVQYTVDTPFGPELGYWTIQGTRSQLQSVGGFIDEAQLQLETSGTESPPNDAGLTGYIEFTWR